MRKWKVWAGTLFSVAFSLAAAPGLMAYVEGFQPDQPGEIRNPDALRPSTSVVTPHTPWARENAAGTLKALFVAPRGALREVAELAQRLDLEPRVVALDRHDTLSAAREGSHRLIWGTRRAPEVLADLRRALDDSYDVIVVGHVQPEIMPGWAWESIAAQARRGTGLVVCAPDPGAAGSGGFAALLEETESTAFPAEIAWAFPGDLREELFSGWGETGGAAPFDARRLGTGRVLVARFAPGRYAILTPGRSLTGHMEDAGLYDYQQALAGRALLWAGKRLAADGAAPGEALVAPGDGYVRISARAPAGEFPAVSAELGVRDRADRSLWRGADAGNGAFQFDVPLRRLPVGAHRADVIFRDEAGRSIDWLTAPVTVSDAQGVSGVAVRPDFAPPGTPVRASVTLRRAMAEDERLELSIIDFHGRVTARETLRAPGSGEAEAILPLGRPLSIVCHLEAELWRDERLVDAARAEIAVEQAPGTGPGHDDFSWLYWSFSDDLVHHRAITRLLPYGLDRLLTSLGSDHVLGAALVAEHYNVRSFPYATQLIGGRAPHQLNPRALVDRFEPLARELLRYGCDTISMGDESSLSARHEHFVNRTSPTFREAMEARHGTIEALNEFWGTAFESWEAVTGLDLEGARETGRRAQFVDTRRYLDGVFARYQGLGRDTAREVDSRYRVGPEGLFQTAWWRGYDWWQIMNHSSSMSNYWFTPAEIHAVRSFKPEDAYWGFWNGAYMDVHNRWLQGWVAWRCLYWGMNSVWWWCDLPAATSGNPFHVFYPDLRISPEVEPFLESVREIKSGPGRLLLGARLQDHGVGIHYSQASLYADALDDYGFETAGAGVPTRLHNAWLNYTFGLGDAGLGHRFVSYEQVEKGDLGDLKVLFLPFSQALSPAEAHALRLFVERGGLLVADMRPGVFDEWSRKSVPGRLDTLFGVRRADRPTVAGPREDLVLELESGGESRSLLLPQTQVDRAVTLDGGTARATAADGTPLLVERQHGAGRALLLNFMTDYALSPYGATRVEKIRGSGRDDGWVDLLRLLLAEAGVRPEVTLTADEERLRGADTVSWHDGAARYFGVTAADFCDYALTCTGPTRAVTGRLARGGHIHDVRGGEYLGEGDSFTLDLPRGGALLLAVLPYRVEGLDGEAGIAADRGGQADIAFAVRADRRPGRHVLRVRVFDPAGRERPEYGAVIEAPEGRGVFRFAPALNDPAGSWTVLGRDAAAGVEAQAEVAVR